MRGGDSNELKNSDIVMEYCYTATASGLNPRFDRNPKSPFVTFFLPHFSLVFNLLSMRWNNRLSNWRHTIGYWTLFVLIFAL